jgi:hypothetical protein
MGLIDDIPTCDELVSRIVADAEELITERLADMVESSAQENRVSDRTGSAHARSKTDFGNNKGSTRAPDGANCLTEQRAQCERVASDRGWQLLAVVKLLGGVTLDQDIAVVESLEVNLDDISTGVVDPHVLNSRGHH